MKDSSIIGHVREACVEFLGNPDRPPDQNLREFYRARRYLGSSDRRKISEIYYGLIRNYRTILPLLFSDSADRRVPSPETVSPVLAVYLSDDPELEPAAIATGTGISMKEFEGITLPRDCVIVESEADRLSLHYGFPIWLTEIMLRDWGSEAESILAALNSEADTAMRYDPERTTFEEIRHQIDRICNVEVTRSGWTDCGILLTGRAPLNGIPALRRGDAFLQDVGSQMIGLVAAPEPGMRLFDACAGAGGKSIHLIDLMKGEGTVVAHDVSSSRLSRLDARLGGLDRPGIQVMYPDEFAVRHRDLAGSFDIVLLDAPCSGTGTIRRNPGLKLSLVPEDLERLALLQREVLDRYADLVRPGGLMVYATCSLLRDENQKMVETFVAQGERGFVIEEINPSDGIPEEMISGGFFRALPNLHGTDGFFAARLRRTSGGRND